MGASRNLGSFQFLFLKVFRGDPKTSNSRKPSRNFWTAHRNSLALQFFKLFVFDWMNRANVWNVWLNDAHTLLPAHDYCLREYFSINFYYFARKCARTRKLHYSVCFRWITLPRKSLHANEWLKRPMFGMAIGLTRRVDKFVPLCMRWAVWLLSLGSVGSHDDFKFKA